MVSPDVTVSAEQVFGVYIDKNGDISGELYMPSSQMMSVKGTMDNPVIQKTNMRITPPARPEECDYVLATLDDTGKRLLTLPCRPLPISSRNGWVLPPNSQWVVMTHPSGKVWAYNESDPKLVLFKNDNTGGCFVFNKLKTDPARKKSDKLANQYSINPGFFTFSESEHRFKAI